MIAESIGSVVIEGKLINARDGARIRDVRTFRVTALKASDVVLVNAA